jgi:FkbM family methyltransferase
MTQDPHFQYTASDVKQIRAKLTDKKSAEIFDRRLMYSLTGDQSFIEEIIAQFGTPDNIAERFEKKEVVLCGAGDYGRKFIDLYKETVNIKTVLDKSPKSAELSGIPVYTYSEYFAGTTADCVYVVSSLYWFIDIKQMLMIEYNVNEEKIVVIPDLTAQYFDFLTPSGIESFVDCGVYDTFSTQSFIKWCGGNYSRIWGFEPESAQYEKALDFYSKNKGCELIKGGVWDSGSKTAFFDSDGISSSISEKGDTLIDLFTIDDVVGDERVTFIKMDIEGAEFPALRGACKTIARCKPKLAISIYHEYSDIINLPRFILETNPDYHFALRHYTFSNVDTVLYAY